MHCKSNPPILLLHMHTQCTTSLCKLTVRFRKITSHFERKRKEKREVNHPAPGRELTYLTRFPIRDSRYLRAESCPSSLLYPLVNRPSACLVGLHGNTTTTQRDQCALLAGSENPPPVSVEDRHCFWLWYL